MRAARPAPQERNVIMNTPVIAGARRARAPGTARTALFAAAFALAASAFAHPAIAGADKPTFDGCMANPPGDNSVDWTGYCCSVSGGTYGQDGHCHFQAENALGGATAPSTPHPMPPRNAINPPAAANPG